MLQLFNSHVGRQKIKTDWDPNRFMAPNKESTSLLSET